MAGTRDNDAARDEDQDSAEGGGMSPMGGKGPSAASAADTEGAFGDAEAADGQGHNRHRDTSSSSTGDSLSEGLMVFDNVGESSSGHGH